MGTADDDAAAGSRFARLLADPVAQGTITGLLTLIPARNYPQWLRRSIVWGPMVIVIAGMATMGANPQVAQQVSERLADSELRRGPELGVQDMGDQRSQPAQQPADAPQEHSESADESEPPGGLRGAALTVLAAAPIGATLSGSMAVALWADEKIERGLRRIRIPFPRAVMGAAAGAATWWNATKETQRLRTRRNPAQHTDHLADSRDSRPAQH